jgi:hypothetical protein
MMMYNLKSKILNLMAGAAVAALFSVSAQAQPNFVLEDAAGAIGGSATMRWHFEDTDPASVCGIDVCLFVPDDQVTSIDLSECFEDVGAPHAGSTFSQCAVRTDGSCFTDPEVPAVPADTSVIRIALIDFGSTIQNPDIAEDAAGFITFGIDGGLSDGDTFQIEAHPVAAAFAECNGTPVTPDVVRDATITANELSAVLNVQPDTLGFGNQQTGTTSGPQTVTVSNDGSDEVDLEITAINISGDFDLAGGTCAIGTTLADAETCTIDVTFSPSADGAAAGTLTVDSDAGQTTNDTVDLSGTGVPSDANLTIDPTSFDFGELDIDADAICQAFTLENTGTDNSLTIGTASVASPFSVSDNCDGVTLDGGDTCVVTACFDPETEDTFSETLTVTSDANSASATLEGEGTAEADIVINPPFGPVNLGFGAPGDTLSAGGTVSNNGSADAEVACEFTSNDDDVFSIDPDLSGGITIVAGGSADFTLSCDLPADAEEGDNFNAVLACSIDGEPAGTHELSCGVSTFEPLPVPTMQAWALALFALMMLLAGAIGIRFFRA